MNCRLIRVSFINNEVYDRGQGGQKGYSILFEKGPYDGFSPDELATMILLTDELEPSMIGYQFTNVIMLG